MKKLPKKYRNPKLYVSLAALILLVLDAMNIKIDVVEFNNITTALLGIAATLGIIDEYKGSEKE